MKKIFGFIFYVFILNTSCSQSPPSEALIGKYSFSNPNVHDSLFVNRDHTYKYVFYATNGQIFESSGTWKYDSIGGEITFEDFSFFNDEGANLPPGYWHSKVRVTDKGEIHLMYSSENNIYFSKK